MEEHRTLEGGGESDGVTWSLLSVPWLLWYNYMMTFLLPSLLLPSFLPSLPPSFPPSSLSLPPSLPPQTSDLGLRENVAGYPTRFELWRKRESIVLQADGDEQKAQWVQDIWDLFFSHMLQLKG